MCAKHIYLINIKCDIGLDSWKWKKYYYTLFVYKKKLICFSLALIEDLFRTCCLFLMCFFIILGKCKCYNIHNHPYKTNTLFDDHLIHLIYVHFSLSKLNNLDKTEQNKFWEERRKYTYFFSYKILLHIIGSGPYMATCLAYLQFSNQTKLRDNTADRPTWYLVQPLDDNWLTYGTQFYYPHYWTHYDTWPVPGISHIIRSKLTFAYFYI